jgi:hypothetical protein
MTPPLCAARARHLDPAPKKAQTSPHGPANLEPIILHDRCDRGAHGALNAIRDQPLRGECPVRKIQLSGLVLLLVLILPLLPATALALFLIVLLAFLLAVM